MKRVQDLLGKQRRLVMGMLSGTSADGIDAVRVLCTNGKPTRFVHARKN